MTKFHLFALVFLVMALMASGCGDDDDDDSTMPETDDDDNDAADDDDSGDDDSADDDDDSTNPYLNPETYGPYLVGNTSYVMEDETRELFCGEGNRRMVVEVWYPASDDADQWAENTFYSFFLDQLEAAIEEFKDHGDLGEPPADFVTGSYRDAPLHPDSGPMPILLFSHGLSSTRFQNYTHANYLASHGYVVVSPDHTCNALLTPLPEGIVTFSTPDVLFTLGERKGDMSFLIDVFTENPPEKFAGRLDNDRVALFGHSFGGFTITETIKVEPRARAMVQLAAFGFPRVPEEVDQPSMYLTGQQDKVMYPFRNWHVAHRDNMPNPRFELSFYDTGHFAFSDLCTYSPWLTNGCGTENKILSEEMFTNPTVEQMNAMIGPYLVAFFGATLFDEPSLWQYLQGNHFPEFFNYFTWLD